MGEKLITRVRPSRVTKKCEPSPPCQLKICFFVAFLFQLAVVRRSLTGSISSHKKVWTSRQTKNLRQNQNVTFDPQIMTKEVHHYYGFAPALWWIRTMWCQQEMCWKINNRTNCQLCRKTYNLKTLANCGHRPLWIVDCSPGYFSVIQLKQKFGSWQRTMAIFSLDKHHIAIVKPWWVIENDNPLSEYIFQWKSESFETHLINNAWSHKM